MEAEGVWAGGFETRLTDERGHTVAIDLPVDEGGTDAGTSALELGNLALAGCITTIFCLVAQRRRLPFTKLKVDLTAERPEGAPTIQRVHGRLEVGTAASQGDVEAALRLTLKTCPMGVLFEKAHIPVEVTALVVPP